jgi:hypothetical protein
MWLLLLQVASKTWKQTCTNIKQQIQNHSLEGGGEHNTWSKTKKETQTHNVECRSIKLQAKLEREHIVQTGSKAKKTLCLNKYSAKKTMSKNQGP